VSAPKTLFDKLWDLHFVAGDGTGADLLAVDRVLLHERTGSVALKSLADTGYAVRDPSRVYAIVDHIVSFREGRGADEARMPGGETFIRETRAMANASGITLIDTTDPRQGIVHVVAPELGLVQPGFSLVCPDSHTCSLGALGALAVGVGSSDVAHAMATGVIRWKKPAQMRITVTGRLQDGVSAKDLALFIIARFGTDGAKRRAVEYCGEAIDQMSVEDRLTLCNLAVEFAAFTAVIAPDAACLDYLEGRRYVPVGAALEAAKEHWKDLVTDDGATFEDDIVIDASTVPPMVTWGTSPQQAVGLDACIPSIDGDTAQQVRTADYMGVSGGETFDRLAIDGAFIGSCTNGRISDLRAAAAVLQGNHIAAGVRAVCVPGSQAVKAQAETEGLDQIFKAAGFEWGAPGCAMCFYAGGETFAPGARVVSSTNRNFEGRQGPGVRTHLASPATVAASAIAGFLTAATNTGRPVRDVDTRQQAQTYGAGR